MLDVFENMKKSIDAQMDFIDALKLEILRLTQEKGDLETTVQSQTRAIKILDDHVKNLNELVAVLRAVNEELRLASGGKGSGHMENGVADERL